MVVYHGVLALNLWLLAGGLTLTLVGFGWLFATGIRERRLIDCLARDGMDRKVAVALTRLRRHPLHMVALALALSLFWMKEYAIYPLPGLPNDAVTLFHMRRVVALCIVGGGLAAFVMLDLAMRQVYRKRLKENRT
jgi:hypothetical protein